MIKVFTLNKNNKIELTKEQLQQLLNESFWDGYRQNNSYTYISPTISPNWTAPKWTVTTATTSDKCFINNNSQVGNNI